MTFVKTPPSQQQIVNWFNQVKLFSGLTEDALTQLIKNTHYATLKQGEIISHEGMPLLACPLVISGEIEVLRHTYLGEEKIFGLFSRYEIVAIAAAFMPHNRLPMTVRAKTDSTILLVDKHSLLELCEQNPIIMKRLLIRFSLKLYEHVNHIDWLTSSSAEQRLAAYFLLQCKQQQSDQFTLPLSRAQLATKLGIRYETLSRLLSGWRKQYVIKINAKLVNVLKVDYLEKLTQPSQRSF